MNSTCRSAWHWARSVGATASEFAASCSTWALLQKTLLIAACIVLPGMAQAERVADDVPWTGFVGNSITGGGTARGSINGGTGLVVNVTTSANNFIGIGNGTTHGSSIAGTETGINAAWYSPNMNPTTGRFGFNTSHSGATTFRGVVGDPLCSHGLGSALGSIVTCHSGSVVTISFDHPVTDPVVHISRLGGSTFNDISGNYFNIWASFRITSPGASLSLLSGNGQLTVAGGNTIAHAAIPVGQMIGSTLPGTALCAGGANVATGCGSVKVTGTFTTLTFDTTLNVQRAAGTSAQELVFPENRFADAVHWMITVPEDYGDAPASYDPSADASHILTDLHLGPLVTADNPNVINVSNSPSPYVGAAMPAPTASGDGGDDGAVVPARILNVEGATTTIPVTLSGASKAGTVCGWIDFDRSGTFNASEGICQSFGAGTTAANLVFTTPAGAGTGDTVVRLRATYDTMTTATFSGLLDSGEVEDHVTKLASPVANLAIVKSADRTEVPTGGLLSYTVNVTNSGPDAADGAVVRDVPGVGLACPAPSTVISCSATGGAICPGAASLANLLGAAGSTVPTFPMGGTVQITLQCRVTATGTP